MCPKLCQATLWTPIDGLSESGRFRTDCLSTSQRGRNIGAVSRFSRASFIIISVTSDFFFT